MREGATGRFFYGKKNMTGENQIVGMASAGASVGAGVVVLPNTSGNMWGEAIAYMLIVSGMLVIASFIAMKLYVKLTKKK